jgi:hypothetical protein
MNSFRQKGKHGCFLSACHIHSVKKPILISSSNALAIILFFCKKFPAFVPLKETDVYTDNYHECFFFVVILYRFDRLENVHSTHIKYQSLDMDKIP